MNAPRDNQSFTLQLKDSKLFRQQAYIDGQWADADNGQTCRSIIPPPGAVIGTIAEDGCRRRRGARSKQPIAHGRRWRSKLAKERGSILRKWFDLMVANQDDLALIMTTEQGKPLTEAKGEIAYAASFIEWFAEEAQARLRRRHPGPQADKRLVVIKQPVGVCARDHALEFSGGHDHPQGRAGAGGRLHDGDQAGYADAVLGAGAAELAERAGVPKGVINVITGQRQSDRRRALPAARSVRKITFTGSTEVGKHADAAGGRRPSRSCRWSSAATRRSSCSTMPISMRRSKARWSPSTAMPARLASAPIESTCRTSVLRSVRGQACRQGRRRSRSARAPRPACSMGPLIDDKAVAKVEEHVRPMRLQKGGQSAGRRQEQTLGGLFFEPTVMTEVNTKMKVTKEETFGPRGAAVPLHRRSRGDRDGERHRVRPGELFYARDMGGSGVWRGARVRHGRDQHRLIANEVAPFGGVKSRGSAARDRSTASRGFSK